MPTIEVEKLLIFASEAIDEFIVTTQPKKNSLNP